VIRKRIAVAIELDEGRARRARVTAPHPSRWTEEDARAFLCTIWELLEANAAESFQLHAVQCPGHYSLECIADRGAAITEPLALSLRSYGWLRDATFSSSPLIVH
jgi:hypothetical protein